MCVPLPRYGFGICCGCCCFVAVVVFLSSRYKEGLLTLLFFVVVVVMLGMLSFCLRDLVVMLETSVWSFC